MTYNLLQNIIPKLKILKPITQHEIILSSTVPLKLGFPLQFT